MPIKWFRFVAYRDAPRSFSQSRPFKQYRSFRSQNRTTTPNSWRTTNNAKTDLICTPFYHFRHLDGREDSVKKNNTWHNSMMRYYVTWQYSTSFAEAGLLSSVSLINRYPITNYWLDRNECLTFLFSIDRELERELFRLVDSRRKLSESEESFAIEMFRISNLIFRKAISIDQLWRILVQVSTEYTWN